MLNLIPYRVFLNVQIGYIREEGADLENTTADKKVDRILIRKVFFFCNSQHYACLNERKLYSSSYRAIFSWFHLSISSITLYNIFIWWLSFFWDSQWILCHAHLKKKNIYQSISGWFLCFWSLWMAFPCHFPIQLATDFTFNGSMFFPSLHTKTKTLFISMKQL